MVIYRKIRCTNREMPNYFCTTNCLYCQLNEMGEKCEICKFETPTKSFRKLTRG